MTIDANEIKDIIERIEKIEEQIQDKERGW